MKASLFANLTNQFLTALFQITSSSILLQIWGNASYAQWIILMTLPGIFLILDFGLISSAQSAVVILTGKGKSRRANNIYSTVWNLILLISIIILCFYTLIAYSGFSEKFFSYLHLRDSKYVRIEVFIILLLAVLNNITTILNIASSSNARYVSTVWTSNFWKLTDIIFLGMIFITRRDIQFFLGMLLISKLMHLFACYFLYERQRNKLKLSLKVFDFIGFKSLIAPSLGYLLFPLGFMFRNQLLLVCLASAVDSESLISFSFTRTLVNFVYQIMGIFNNSVQVKLSNLFALGDIREVFKHQFVTLKYPIFFSLPIVLLILFFGSNIFNIWTQGKVEFNVVLASILLLDVIVNIVWGYITMALVSTNKHLGLSLGIFLSGILTYLSYATLFSKYGVIGAAFALLLGNIFMLFISKFLYHQSLQKPLKQYE